MENKSPQDLRTRTSDFALRIVKLYSSLPKTTEAQVLGKQVLRSGTSVGANYREGHRAKSDSDIVNKFESVLQELDETDYWLDLFGKKRYPVRPKSRSSHQRNQRTNRHLHHHRNQNQKTDGQNLALFSFHPS